MAPDHYSFKQWIKDPFGRSKRSSTHGSPAPTADVVVRDDDKSPIWSQSLQRFAQEKPEPYELIKGRIGEIYRLDADSWDTWSNGRSESESEWFRRCKAYLPRFKTIKSLATSLSQLDPHHLAPYITTGVFVVIELCFESVDPSMREKAITMLLKTSIIISKWVDCEADLKRMEETTHSRHVAEIEKQLPKLYFDSLILIASIYKSGKTKSGRVVANAVSDPEEWDEKSKQLDIRNSACGELKSQVESELKRMTANLTLLNWIRNRSDDPEPVHQSVRARTGINIPTSAAGKWFLESQEFSSWIQNISLGRAEKQVFWLKGAMGMGKTTLICRVISHFEDLPIGEVRFVRYYCSGSKTGENSKGPGYEIMLRALCYRLAWNGDGDVARVAKDRYDQFQLPDAEPTPETWEALLKDLVASSSTPIVFVIDALDECKNAYDYKKFLKFLHEMPWTTGGPYCLISSRPHVPIGEYFDGSVQIFDARQPQTDQDMKCFIETQVALKRDNVIWRNSIFFGDPALCERLESALRESARGMFRWVEIWLGIFFPRNDQTVERRTFAEKLLEELKNARSLDQLSENETDTSGVDNIKTLKGAYQKLWDINGGKQWRDVQTRVFRIVTGALTSLTPQQLLEAVRFNPGGTNYEEIKLEQLEGLYCNFLRTNSRGYLDFEHLSAEIFVSEITEQGSGNLIFSERESSKALADIAIKAMERPDHPIWKTAGIHLISWREELREEKPVYPNVTLPAHLKRFPMDILDPLDPLDSLDPLDPFGSYLFKFWLKHCQNLRDDHQIVQRMSKLFLHNNLGPEGWTLTRRHIKHVYYPESDTLCRRKSTLYIDPLLCMMTYGFSPFSHDAELRPVLLPGFEDTTARNEYGKTALHLACRSGNNALVEDLLKFECAKRGSCISLLVSKDNRGHMPLFYASSEEGIIKTLLQYEALETPIASAVNDRRTSRMLDDAPGGSIDFMEELIEDCSEEFLQWLLESYNLERHNLDRLLLEAVDANKMKAANCLIKLGAGIEKGSEGESALCIAAFCGHLSMAAFLLDKGAEVNALGGLDGTALHAAAYEGDVDMEDLLLSRGASIDSVNESKETALSMAVKLYEPIEEWEITWKKRERRKMIKFLIEKGANVRLLDEESRAKLGRLLSVQA
ncbi:hypothetical protein F5Y06DRAFT_254644 [Hypoxylon sp. FL0890]|nr:hypothetical protein F5Y06DRAFT_254644 [Hypoxylon sp. FL0890]